jgi:hypothetical protein
MPIPQRHALVHGDGPHAATVARTLREDGWVLSPADTGERWLFLIARGSETEASPLLTMMRDFAMNLGDGTRGGIVLLLDLSHAQPRAGEAAPPFAAALAQRSLTAAVPLLALEFAPRLRVNAVGTLPGSPQLPQGTPEADIAAALRFIIDAPALTGQMIALDGGRTALVPAPAPGTSDFT